jgi:hypothetical protein
MWRPIFCIALAGGRENAITEATFRLRGGVWLAEQTTTTLMDYH